MIKRDEEPQQLIWQTEINIDLLQPLELAPPASSALHPLSYVPYVNLSLV